MLSCVEVCCCMLSCVEVCYGMLSCVEVCYGMLSCVDVYYGMLSCVEVCYGMLYGIGAKALGEQLSVDVNDASAFMETFKARYPGKPLYTILLQTVEFNFNF